MKRDGALLGKRVLVTRSPEQAGAFVAELKAYGAEVMTVPMIRIERPADSTGLEAAVQNLEDFDGIVFTSTNGVRAFWAAMTEQNPVVVLPEHLDIFAIGPSTGDSIRERGGIVTFTPTSYVSEDLVEEASGRFTFAGRRLLIVRPEVARDVVAEGLRSAGAAVVEVEAYRTVPARVEYPKLSEEMRRGNIDVITLTSSSTARIFATRVGTEIGRARVASIGPITSASAREVGLPVHIEATNSTMKGLTESIVEDVLQSGLW